MMAPVGGAKCPKLSHVLPKSLYPVTQCKHEPVPPDPRHPPWGALSVEWPCVPQPQSGATLGHSGRPRAGGFWELSPEAAPPATWPTLFCLNWHR